MYPAFMYPCPTTIVEVPVSTPTEYISSGGGIPLGARIMKNITIKTEFINIERKKKKKDINIKIGDNYVTKSKR
jgi:hypothetical protein